MFRPIQAKVPQRVPAAQRQNTSSNRLDQKVRNFTGEVDFWCTETLPIITRHARSRQPADKNCAYNSNCCRNVMVKSGELQFYKEGIAGCKVRTAAPWRRALLISENTEEEEEDEEEEEWDEKGQARGGSNPQNIQQLCFRRFQRQSSTGPRSWHVDPKCNHQFDRASLKTKRTLRHITHNTMNESCGDIGFQMHKGSILEHRESCRLGATTTQKQQSR